MVDLEEGLRVDQDGPETCVLWMPTPSNCHQNCLILVALIPPKKIGISSQTVKTYNV